ncbi:MAG: alpha/beta fold hydrolase [Defluviitaleaceae bacterium]|nr:alpha/beta fold hydrolase [Defluviitaleaceae bacterium]
MRKTTKALLAIGAIIATPVIINHVIAKKAEKRIGQRIKESEYSWEYGSIRYVTAGDGPPLLLVHGIYPGASSLEWEGTMAHFAEKHKVYAIDLLGFGYSAKPALDYCGYLYVRLIKDFIENVIGQPVTAAASLHSAAALVNCAALNPEDFKKIILVSPTGLEGDTPMPQDEDSGMKKVLESPIFGTSFYNGLCSKKALTEFFPREGLLAQIPDPITLDKIYLAAHAEAAGGKYALASLLTKYFNTNIKDNLDNLAMPYHIILGDHTPTEGTFTVWHGIDSDCHAPTTIIENANLLPHMEDPEKFYKACKHFL